MILDDTAAKGQLNRLLKHRTSLDIKAQRLGAEREGEPNFNPDLTGVRLSAGPEIAEVLGKEQKEFSARQARFRSEHEILNKRLEQLNESRRALAEQKKALEKQASVVQDELARKDSLLQKGLINRSEYTELLRVCLTTCLWFSVVIHAYDVDRREPRPDGQNREEDETVSERPDR